LRILVCQSCMDKPQENIRTIVIPPDPLPVVNPRPEDYTDADNPIGPLGYDPISQTLGPAAGLGGGNIGNLTLGGGLHAAFITQGSSQGTLSKTSAFSAYLSNSQSGFNNTVGKNWSASAGAPRTVAAPRPNSGFTGVTNTYNISQVLLQAPSDMPFLRSGSTTLKFQGSNDDVNWTDIASVVTAGVAGEQISIGSSQMGAFATTNFAFHRINISGDGISSVGIATIVFNAAGPSGAFTSGDIG
jgi:hypothetical protein